jgi:acetylglutamate kinase
MLESRGGRAIGISGMDGSLITAEAKDPRLGYVGRVTDVNIKPVFDLLEKGYIPVISTVGSDHGGNVYNINGDTAAAFIAGALGAERLIMMTDIDGILLDKNDPSSLIPELNVSEIEALTKSGVISGGMIPKVECCLEALSGGVKNVVILDGRVPHSILMELLTNEGAGTWIHGGEDKE